MRSDLPLYLRVYSSIVRQIFDGTLKCGDKLPSKQNLCQEYCVGENTIKLTMKQLKQNDFIETSKRKRAVVKYDFQNSETKKRWLEILELRRAAVADAMRAYDLLHPLMLAAGAKHCTSKEIRELNAIVVDLSLDPKYIREFRNQTEQFHTAIISKAENSFFLFVNKKLSPVYVLPAPGLNGDGDSFYPFRVRIQAYCRNTLSLLKGGRIGEIGEQVIRMTEILEKADIPLLQHLNPVVTIEEEALQERPAARNGKYSSDLLTDILIKYLTGQYRRGELLPTEADLRKTYHISVTSARATYHVLNEIGIACTRQGRGTQILSCGLRDLSWVEKEKDVIAKRLRHYFEVMNFLIITSEAVVKYAVGKMSPEEVSHTVQWFRESHPAYAPMLFLDLLAPCHNAYFDEVYTCVKEYMLWGVYLIGAQESLLKHHQNLKNIFLEASDCLEKGNIDIFAKTVKDFFVYALGVSQKSTDYLNLSPYKVFPDKM